MQFSTLIFIYLNFSFGITLVIFMKSHVMPNVYLLQNFMTFVAICFKYLFVFSAFFALFFGILYLRMRRILENFKCLKFSYLISIYDG